MEDVSSLKTNIAATPIPAENSESPDVIFVRGKKLVRTAAYINRQEAKKPYCEICDFQLSAETVHNHIWSERHIDEFRRHGCDGIRHFAKKYRCRYCDEKLPSIKRVYHHVKTKKHLEIVEATNSNDKQYRDPNILKNIDKNEKLSSYITIDKIGDTKYFCHVCRGSIFFCHESVDSHIGGNRHKKSFIYYGCDKIAIAENDKYYCHSCDCEFLKSELGKHVRSREHFHRIVESLKNRKFENNENSNILNTLKKSSIVVTNSSLKPMNSDDNKISNCNDNCLGAAIETPISSMNVEKSNSSEDINIKENSSKIKENSKKIEDIFDAETELHRRLFTSISNWTRQSNICLICVTKFNTNYAAYGKNRDKLLSAHIRGEKHAVNVAKYGCDKIVSIDVNKYYCECCNNVMLGARQVRRHISSENHLRLVKTALREKISFGISSDVASFICSIKQNSKWIADTYYCWICGGDDDDEYSISQKFLKDHLETKLHKDSLKKYGCDDIIRRYSNNYYCYRCETELDDVKKVFFHVKEEKHLNEKRIVAVPYSKNMISNFVLQENPSDSECITSGSDPQPPDAKKMNNETKDRDLSLHFISSDPNVLCRGTIPLHMQKYAKKIVKQKIDDPYCLICDFEIPGYPAIDDHINGKRHADSLVRTGGNKVFVKKVNNIQRYTCGWCMDFKTTDIEAIYRHIRTKDHLSRVRCLRPVKSKAQCEEATKRREDNSPYDRKNFADFYENQPDADFDSGCVNANEGNNEKPLNFNSIFSSISDDLSRMLAHFEESNNAKGAKKQFRELKFPTNVKKNVETKVKRKKKKRRKRFAETSPDREGGYVCTVCKTIFPRKAELHCHMAYHFGEEFGRIESDAENSLAASDTMSQSDDSSDDEEKSKVGEKTSQDGEKRSNAGEKKSENPEEILNNLFFR